MTSSGLVVIILMCMLLCIGIYGSISELNKYIEKKQKEKNKKDK